MYHAQNFEFLSIYRKQLLAGNIDERTKIAEQYFLNVFELGVFDVYQFLYQFCKDDTAFVEWIIEKKGLDFFNERKEQFLLWYLGKINLSAAAENVSILSKQQIDFWNQNGYLQIENVVPATDCDNVIALICETLKISINDSNTWYPQHSMLQGLMLQLYDGAVIEKIRKSEQIFDIFAQLYGTSSILANTEKVSYNPPETANFKFRGSDLHWDIDFSVGNTYYIQGLVYLNDVPANRGAFKVVPAYHKVLDKNLAIAMPELLIETVKVEEEVVYLSGKKGDLILWLQSIPHAASANTSNLPRFVQYVSFTKFDEKL